MLTVQKMYQDYLKKVNLNEDQMNPIEKTRTKEAFFAGCSSLLAMMQEDFQTMSDDEGVDVLDKLFIECSEYWHDRLQEFANNNNG